jgi:glycosyltransferase involved in cell wall biosynthesis
VTENGSVFHPLNLTWGMAPLNETISDQSLEGGRTEDLMEMDFVIDMSAAAKNIQQLRLYYFFKRYCCYRNGFHSYGPPRVYPEDKHYVVPSKQNRESFRSGGFDAHVQYYGISPFYNRDFTRADLGYFGHFTKKTDGFIRDREYYLFPHRLTPEKGTKILIELAKAYPKEKFVIATDTPITGHQEHRIEVARTVKDLPNLKFVTIPFTPQHHFYKRELLRRAKAVLSPFDYPNYLEGFGLVTAETIACETPVIISDSPSSHELWRHGVDGLIVQGLPGFKMAIDHFSSYNFQPKNRYFVEDYAKGYERIMQYYLENDAIENSAYILSKS